MTGWRCGWAVGPVALVSACNAIQSHSTSNVCSISQRAAEAALRGPQDCVTEMLDEYRRRRDRLYAWLSVDPSIRMTKPAGAFYMFPDVSEYPVARRRPHVRASSRRRCSTTRAWR